jgi:apolipoprotein N-acyltransferase
MLAPLADYVRALRGWRRVLLTIALGAVAALALPPFHIIPVLLVAFSGLIWILEGHDVEPRPLRGALLTGFWFGFGHFFLGLHWIVEPMLVDPARTAWMIPFSWPGLAAGLAIFPALACGVQAIGRFGNNTAARVLVFAGLWTVSELLRGFVLTGFPWNLIGYVWAGNGPGLPMLQASAVVGVLGLGTITILASAMPAVLGAAGPGSSWRSTLVLVITLLIPALLWSGGLYRLQNTEDSYVPDVRLRIVQANIAQKDKWNPELRTQHLEKYIRLTNTESPEKPTHVIWPETAVPFLLANDALIRGQVARAIPPEGALITGSVRSAFHDGGRQLFNSLLVIDWAANITQVYDKSHLVPFGEYVPLRGVLPVEKIVPGQGDFTAGPARRLIDVTGLPAFSPLICYEAIFPGQVTPDDVRPAWLLNLTNDAWFGNFAGPWQHLAIATSRTVEEGLPMVRAANTGISAVVDAHGRVQGWMGVGVEGVLDTALPRPIPATPFARWGNLIPLILALGLVVLGLVLLRRRDTA